MKKYLLAIILLVIWPFTVWGAGAFISAPKFAVEDANGAPLSGGLVYTYECGTTTPKTTYSDRALGSANANPVVLDSRGEAGIYQSGCLKIILKTSAGVTIYTVDNFAGVGESFLQDADGDTLINVEESADEDIVRVDIGGTEQVTIQDGKIEPTTDDDVDLGSSSKQFKDAYIDGKAYIDTISGHSFPGFLQRPKFTYVESLDYDGGTLDFTVGETVTGAGAATGVIVAISTTSTTTSGTVYLDTRNATAYVNDEVITSAAGAAVANQISAKNAVVISPFVYYHCGTTEQLLYSDLNIAYEFVSLGTSDWSYLYFDDSAIVTAATNLITASQLIDNIGEPVYNVTKHGRYHETTLLTDMCFFAVLTDSGDDMLEFFHDGGNYIQFSDMKQDVTVQDIDGAWEDIEAPLSIPSFVTKANIHIDLNAGDTSGMLSWRTNGSIATTTHYIFYHVFGLAAASHAILDVITDSGHLIELYYADGTNVVNVDVNGWYFPNGM